MKSGQKLCLWLVGLLLAATGMAEELRPLALVPDVEPWGYADSQAQPAGLLADFYQVLFARARLSPTIELRPYARVLQDLATGQAHLSVMFRGPAADKVARSLGLVVPTPVLVLARPGSSARALADLAGGQVGFLRGSRYGKVFDDDASFRHIPVNNADQGLRMLLAGRLDALVCTLQALMFALEQTGVSGDSLRLVTQLPATGADLYVSLAVGQPTWEAALTGTLQAMREDGSLAHLFSEHSYWSMEPVCFSNGPCIASGAHNGTEHE